MGKKLRTDFNSDTLYAIRSLAKHLARDESPSSSEMTRMIRGLEQTPKDWGMHSWLAYFYVRNDVPLDTWPEFVKHDFLQNERRGAILLNNYTQFTQQLQRNEIEFTPLKGVWLSENLLPAYGIRCFGDADIWIDENAYRNIHQILNSLGFLQTDRLHHRFHFHKTFKRELQKSHLTFEVHNALTLNDFVRIDHKSVWNNAHRYDNDCEISLLPEDQLIYFFCHNTLHFYDRPCRLFDLPLVYSWAKDSTYNTVKLIEKITEWRCRRLFLFSVVSLEWLLEENILSHLFNQNEQDAARAQFNRWLQSFTGANSNKISLRRHDLSDSLWLSAIGYLHPNRILGALVDRLGMY